MKFVTNLSLVAALAMTTGCASVMNDSSQVIRVETYTAAGEEVKDMDCKAENDYGVQNVKTPGSVQMHRSNKDLHFVCTKAEIKDAKGTSISRANAGLAGNILIGGGIGALIDHTKGTAYTYPQWVRLVVDKLMTFDRRADKDGAPNLGQEVVTAVAPAAAASTPVVAAAPATPASAVK